jgi:Holliday junction resolvasome RuvABC ATP-dependent DNA helicase subunit
VSCLLIKCCKYFVFCSSTSAVLTAVLTNVINDSFNYTVTRHRWNCQELKYIIFRSALALSSPLIHVLAHLQRTTCSQNYFRFSSYLLRKTAFICNIDRDWMIYHKHPIRSLLTSMLRKANFRYLSDVYALSFEKYKGK